MIHLLIVIIIIEELLKNELLIMEWTSIMTS